MAIVHDIAVSYLSTLDPLYFLYDLSYDDTLTNRPLNVLMHGFSLDRTSIVASWKERVVNYGDGGVAIAVDMRGRNDSEGGRDVNARELYDIWDAIQHALATYSTRIDPTNINILGYSGGGGNVLKMLCAYPDLFGIGCSYFGISDYGYDDPDGWWHTTPGQRPNLENWIGDTPANIPDDYYIRSGLFFLENAKYTRSRVYHDRQDTGVPIINTDNVQSAITALGYGNWVINISDIGDPLRYIHGNPIVGQPGEENIPSEPEIFAEINAGTYKNLLTRQ